MTEKPGFRNTMNWLHTWAGVTLGTLLFTIWWMGTLCIFDKEIDRWMQPETRALSLAGGVMNADAVVAGLKMRHPEDDLVSLMIQLPRERRPWFEVGGKFNDAGYFSDRLHPQTGETLGESSSHAASGFFYTMHYRLFIPGGLGYFTVAFGTLFMMVLLVTGVVIHRKIFVDFFTFRSRKNIRRSSLDLHNITGVVFLPFHFLICLSGFAIFAGFYMSLPFTISNALSEDDRTVKLFHASSDYGFYRRDPLGETAEMAPIAPFVSRAEAIWTQRYNQPATADRIDLYAFGDRNAVVEVRRYFPSQRTEGHRDSINFDGVTGEILKDFQASPVRQVRTWLEGFHQIQFDHWPLRWLYFIAGLSGCILIATGFIFYTASRRQKDAASQPVKVRVVEAMGAFSVTGMILATLGYMCANRLLPADAVWSGFAKPELEIRLFFLLWAVTLIHALLRSRRAWAEQAWMIVALCICAVALNWITTGDHWFTAVEQGLWSVVGTDLVLVFSAATAAFSGLRLSRRAGADVGKVGKGA